MKKITVKYRVETDWVYNQSDDLALSVSSPHYDYESALKEYKESIKDFCVDDKTKHARVKIWEYEQTPTGRYKTHKGQLIMKIIKSNY